MRKHVLKASLVKKESYKTDLTRLSDTVDLGIGCSEVNKAGIQALIALALSAACVPHLAWPGLVEGCVFCLADKVLTVMAPEIIGC